MNARVEPARIVLYYCNFGGVKGLGFDELRARGRVSPDRDEIRYRINALNRYRTRTVESVVWVFIRLRPRRCRDDRRSRRFVHSATSKLDRRGTTHAEHRADVVFDIFSLLRNRNGGWFPKFRSRNPVSNTHGTLSGSVRTVLCPDDCPLTFMFISINRSESSKRSSRIKTRIFLLYLSGCFTVFDYLKFCRAPFTYRRSTNTLWVTTF